jgi:riboflavin kinase/FMN adenylyltransferase
VKLISNFTDLTLEKSWLTIGIFDGVHRGHQEILTHLVNGAHAAGALAVVLTFSPHPAVVLGGVSDFKFITTSEERAELLNALGVDIVINQEFTREFANQSAEEFMQAVSPKLGLRQLILGYDTAFGRGRSGDAARLTEIGKALGYKVQRIPPLSDSSGIISSTRIRQKISLGKVVSANTDLGRNFFVEGPVIHGHERGRTINIPTANIQIPYEKIFPAYGIYACKAFVNAERYLAATSVGIRPTFFEDEIPAPTIEAHFLDFNKDIYGQTVKLEFVKYLRPEEKYTSIKALVNQIRIDISQTREIVKV